MKTHRCGRLAVRVPLLMHHGAGDASRASVEADTCWTVRAGISAEVESPRRLCLVYMVDGGWWMMDRPSRARNEPVARGRACWDGK
jgi:hypothetical protein